MSDPLTIADAAVGLLSSGLQSTEYLYNFYTPHRDRDHHLARTVDELGRLLHSLETINDVVRTRKWRDDEQTTLQYIESSLSRCQDVISELTAEAQKFQEVSTTSLDKVIIGFGRRVVYPFRRSTLEKLNEDVNDFCNSLLPALQALRSQEQQDFQSDLEEVRQVIRTIYAQDVTARVRQWLNPSDATIDYNHACSKRRLGSGTGQWFTQSTAFNSWLQHENSFLWLHGFAGCGKSVLCSTAIQHTFRYQQAQMGSAVAFFFFKFNDESKQDCSATLRTLLFQLIGQVTGLEKEIARLINRYYGTPSVFILMDCLRAAVTKCRHIYILLDALDENPEGTARFSVLRMIETMRQWKLPGLHLLVTSRDVADIRDVLDAREGIPNTVYVTMKNDGLNEDIENYISYQVDHELRRWDDASRRRIKDYLSQHAGGVFRWVNCQLEPLKKCPLSAKHLEHCLKTLPLSLDQTYERMLCSIDEMAKDIAQRTLMLLCLCIRPLTGMELLDILSVDVDNEYYDSDSTLQGPEDLLRACAGLVTTTPGSAQVNSSSISEGVPGGEIMLTSHFSINEYLLSDRITRSRASEFAVSQSAHSKITHLCLIYLNDETFLDTDLNGQILVHHPFAAYAARYWILHYQRMNIESAAVLTLALRLFTVQKAFHKWLRLYDEAQWLQVVDADVPESQVLSQPKYYASIFGLHHILPKLIEQDPEINFHLSGTRYGSMLQAAAAKGHKKIVEYLLSGGANIQFDDSKSRYGTALQAAAAHGHADVVRMLLEAGSDVNAEGGRYGTALLAATVKGFDSIVTLLLDYGAYVNVQWGSGGTALYSSSYSGNTALATILLSRGADPNVQGGRFTTALQAAAIKGRSKITQLLLSHGADVNMQSGRYGNALQAATHRGHIRIVKQLLEKGAAVNARGGQFNSALQAAAGAGHTTVVQLLLDRGADVDAQGGQYGTALQAASYAGQTAIVKVLLDKGANVDAIGGQFVTALHAGSIIGDIDIVNQLINAGAALNRSVMHFGTALYSASARGHEDVVKTLIAHGADVNATGGQYGNAIQAASVGGYDSIASILQHHGAQSNQTNAPVEKYLEDDKRSLGSTLVGSLSTATTWFKYLSEAFTDLFAEDPRFQPFLHAVTQFSTIENNRLSSILDDHLKIFAAHLKDEFNAKRNTSVRRGCDFLVQNASTIAEGVVKSCDKWRVSPDMDSPFSSLLTQTQEEEGRKLQLANYLDEQERYLSSNEAIAKQGAESSHTTPDQSQVLQYLETSGVELTINDIESDGSSSSSESDLDESQAPVEFDTLKEIFDESISFDQLLVRVWRVVDNDLFDYNTISNLWRLETSQPLPREIRDLSHDEIELILNETCNNVDHFKLRLEKFTGQIWDWRPFRPPRRNLAPGKVRLRWTNCCGSERTMDVSPSLAEKIKAFTKIDAAMRKDIERDEQHLHKMPEFDLREDGSGQQATNSSAQDPNISSAHRVDPNISNPSPPNLNTSIQQSTSSNTGKPITSQPTTIHGTPGSSSTTNSLEKYFILLCVRTSGTRLSHDQIEICKDVTDNQFLAQLRETYRQLRGWRYYLHPDQFYYCHCSRFVQWDVGKIGSICYEMPTDPAYHYQPRPPVRPYVPPLPMDEWEQRFEGGCMHSRNDLVDLLPKRITRFQTHTCMRRDDELWGLEVMYRPSAKVVMCWTVFFLAPCVVFLVLWLCGHSGDLQNAAVPLMFAIGALPVGYVVLGGDFKAQSR